MTFDAWLAFALASAVAIPGPVVIFVLGRSAAGGWRAAVAGVALGGACLLDLALLGLGALTAGSAASFAAVKWGGAAWLVWLGRRLWHAPPAAPLAARRAFRDAFVVTVPKRVGFFVALLPRFPDPARPALLQGATRLVTFVAIGTLNLLGYAALATRLPAAIRRSRVRRWTNRAGGGAIMGAGLATALARR